MVCHVAFADLNQPFVIPVLYGRDGDRLFLHGSAASRLLRQLATGIPACLSVALLDGVVLARSAFHHSVNYRSVVAFGTATLVTDQKAKLRALEVISEHLIPGRWREVRSPSSKELKATAVIEFLIEEASAKIRQGPPKDDAEDLDFPVWAGVIPIAMRALLPVADPHLADGAALTPSVVAFAGRLQR